MGRGERELLAVSKGILKLIGENIPGFSKGQRYIANYILTEYDKAAFMTAAKLGKTVGVSESTVVRFAMELGFDGYPELQKALQEMIRNKLTSIQRMDVAEEQMGAGGDVLYQVLNQDIDRIKKTMEEASPEDFNAVIDDLLTARNIYIIGARSSSYLASFMMFYFHLMFDNVRLVSNDSASEIFEQILRIGPGDVIIGFSFPRYSTRTCKALRFAKDRGANVVAITDSHSSPIVPFSNHILLARSDMASFVDSLVAPLSLINALIVGVSMRKKEEMHTTFEKLETIWTEYDIYHQSEENDTRE